MRGAQERRLSEQSDEDLVRKYQEAGGSEDALLELYERHRTVTYAFFCRRIGIPEIAAEENQELYLSVVKHLNSIFIRFRSIDRAAREQDLDDRGYAGISAPYRGADTGY